MVEVRTIRTFQEFQASVELRTTVYRGLGYLQPSCALDVDAFDSSSIHFVALADDTVVGTVRLILPIYNNDRFPPAVANSAEWVARLRVTKGLAALNATDLPVSETLETNELPADQFPRCSAELSRIIVASSHRGLGIGHGLVSAVVSRAREMSIETLLLQCRPNHIRWFQDSGFELWMEGLSYTLLCITEDIVVMRMRLNAVLQADGLDGQRI